MNKYDLNFNFDKNSKNVIRSFIVLVKNRINLTFKI